MASKAPAFRDKELRIGELANRLGLNPRTIRFYEQIGVLPEPERAENRYRVYSEADEERLRFVKSAQRVGLSLGEIKETLAFRELGERPCSYVYDVVGKRLDEVDQRLRELRATKRELRELRKRMRAEGIDEGGGPYCHHISAAAG